MTLDPLNEVELRFVTPSNEAEATQLVDEAVFLSNFMSPKPNPDEFRQNLLGAIGEWSLIYANGVLFAGFQLELFKNTAELHGVIRPDAEKLVPQYRRVKLNIHRIILDAIFEGMGKRKLVIKGPESNPGVKGYARIFGFKKLQNKENGNSVWVLTKEAYLKRINEIGA